MALITIASFFAVIGLFVCGLMASGHHDEAAHTNSSLKQPD